MCGIAGYVSEQKLEESVIRKMAETFRHRGPDGEGYYHGKLGKRFLALAHKRLAIFDLTENGKQPMFTPDGKIGVVYNGEIYNFREIRKELQGLGYQFRSDCDTEVVLYSYCAWGIEAVKKFNGMFAYSIIDMQNEKIYLVRDRMGKKPLYYYCSGDDFCWASDLAALECLPFIEKRLDRKIIASYLWNQYIPAPYTIYENIWKLNSGCILTYSDGKISVSQYWNMNGFIRKKENVENSDEMMHVFEETLMDAVAVRMEADVPVGVFLSGGIDSTLIAAMAQKQAKAGIDTFTIGFRESGFDESIYAKRIADYLGCRHHMRYFTAKDALALVEKIPIYFSEPFADNSQLPMLLLSSYAKEHITVALSGDGGDELFCGYPWYEQVKKMNQYKRIAGIFHGLFPHFSGHKNGDRNMWRLAKFFNAYSEQNILNLDYITSKEILAPLFKDSSYFLPEFFQTDWKGIDIMEKAEFLQMHLYLQDDIMTKVDRTCMAYSLESRAPLLDYRIVEQSIAMPISLKYESATLKAVLKKILYQYVPKELVERPKQGFGVPLSQWLHHDFSEMIGDYMREEFLRRQGIFCTEAMTKLYDNYKNRPSVILDKIMWSILMFQIWYEAHIDMRF